MLQLKHEAAFLLLLACAVGQAGAQSTMPKLKGVPSLVKGGLPGVSSISAGNAAGLLGYCVKNKFLGGGSADSVLGGLTRKPGVTGSKDYSLGQAGQILNGKDPPVSLGQIPKELKSQACNMVLKQGASFL